jgi:hypothetical protein
VKRILAGFAVLMVGLILLQLAAQRWAGPLIESWRLAPRTAFVQLTPLSPDAYLAPDMWLVRPDLPDDPARTLPPGMGHQHGAGAYVFVVHPTTFLGRTHWNAPLDHPDSQMRARLALRTMASVFNDAAAIYAPRYRQAALGTFVIDLPESRMALASAEDDVRTAFATFARAVPPDAPIILVGSGQGALITLHLLRDAVRGTLLAPRIAAVYLTGWPVSPAHDLAMSGLAACTAPGQTRCVMAWMSFAEPADPARLQMMAAHYPALDGHPQDGPALCTNPLTGGAASAAPAAANLGSLAIGDERGTAALITPGVAAHCDAASGLLMIGQPPHLGDQVMTGNDYTMFDFALFWRNLRIDVARRTGAWQQERAHR